MTFFICVFVLLMQFLWKYIDDLVGKGLDWKIVAELLAYASFALIPLAFPLAMLLSSIMTFGNFGENYELVAMKASGISLFRIMRPLLVLAILLTTFAFFFSNNILPKTNLKFHTLLYSVRHQKPEMIIKEGVFVNDMPNFSLKVERKGKDNNMLYDVMIYNHADNQGNIKVTVADSGKMVVSQVTATEKYMAITLYNGHNYEEGRERNAGTYGRKYPFLRESFTKETININMNQFEFKRMDENQLRSSSRMMSAKDLVSQGDSLFSDYKIRLWHFVTSLNYGSEINRQVNWLSIPIDSLRKNPNIKSDTLINIDQTIAAMSTFEKTELYRKAIGSAQNNSQTISQTMDEMYKRRKFINSFPMEWHRKFTLSFACLIFFFIGAPLGAIIRKGGLGMPVVVSILMFIAYYILMITGEKFASEDAWSMIGGMWFASMVFLPLGGWLTYKAATDSGVMNMESYQELFKKLTNLSFLKRKKTKEEK